MRGELRAILDCIQDGVFITDGNGKILALNQASLDLCLYGEDELVGKTMQDLIAQGMFDDAASLKAIERRATVSETQRGISGEYDLLVTATPYFNGDEISMVIVTERDTAELTNLKEALDRLNTHYEREVGYYKTQASAFGEIICKSPSMKSLLQVALRISATDATVLIQGESGTGKEMIAKFIYKNSNRNHKPFVKINCGAIPENLLESELFGYDRGAFTGASESGKAGLFEVANNGTLFLDEIGSLPFHLQVKILRAIQEKEILRIGGAGCIPIDIRIIAATNANLINAVKNGAFRKDLYYRLNVCQLELPPLRNRREDIQPLCEHFLGAFNAKYRTNKSFSSSAWKILHSYQWPGNIRELENMLERIIVISDNEHIKAEHISTLFPSSKLESRMHENASAIDLKRETEGFEKNLILSKSKYFKSASELAAALGVDRSTMARKLRKYDIKL
jgi:PAS domain S-box-containing protein